MSALQTVRFKFLCYFILDLQSLNWLYSNCKTYYDLVKSLIWQWSTIHKQYLNTTATSFMSISILYIHTRANKMQIIPMLTWSIILVWTWYIIELPIKHLLKFLKLPLKQSVLILQLSGFIRFIDVIAYAFYLFVISAFSNKI